MVRRLGALALVLGICGAAIAGDEGETIVQAKDSLEAAAAAHEARDADALATAYVRIVELHNGMEGDGWRKKLRASAGDVLRDKKCPELHSAAMTALEQMDDGDGVFAEMKKFLPKPKDTEASELQLYGIGIVGQLRSPKGSKYLLDLAEDGHNLSARKKAITALGRYRAIGKVRGKVLKGLLEILVALYPDGDSSDADRELWQALEPPLVASLDALTYLDLKSGPKWVSWHAGHKSKLKEVFDGVDADDD